MWYRNTMKLTLNMRVSSGFQSPVMSISNTRKSILCGIQTPTTICQTREGVFSPNCKHPEVICQLRKGFFSRYLSIEK